MQPGLELSFGFIQTDKPILDSYDSGEECSLSHWIELCKLVDESDLPEAERPLELTASEV